MKIFILTLLGHLCICICQGNGKTNATQYVKGSRLFPTVYYITNWNMYKMPKNITTVNLKNVMEKVDLYRNLKYCPFGKKIYFENCVNITLTNVVRKIIADVVGIKYEPALTRNGYTNDNVINVDRTIIKCMDAPEIFRPNSKEKLKTKNSNTDETVFDDILNRQRRDRTRRKKEYKSDKPSNDNNYKYKLILNKDNRPVLCADSYLPLSSSTTMLRFIRDHGYGAHTARYFPEKSPRYTPV